MAKKVAQTTKAKPPNPIKPRATNLPTDEAITYHNKPTTMSQYLANKGRAMREHVGLPPMPKLTPCMTLTMDDTIALAMCYCTQREIEDIGSSDVVKSSTAISKANLKRKMLEKGLAGDTQMMNWLSKQHLGYSEPRNNDEPSTTINILTTDMPSVLDNTIEVKS